MDNVTDWIHQLTQGDELAAQRIWERYYGQLLSLARRKLSRSRRRTADEEDVVLSAFNSFCEGVAAGRFPRLDDRHDLWKVLLTLTARKAAGQMRRERARKRGGGAVRGESVFRMGRGSKQNLGINQVLGAEPTPAFAALVTDECEQLMASLDDESLRAIALLKLEGYTNEEMAQELGCGLRTVERKLARIRDKWAREDKT